MSVVYKNINSMGDSEGKFVGAVPMTFPDIASATISGTWLAGAHQSKSGKRSEIRVFANHGAIGEVGGTVFYGPTSYSVHIYEYDETLTIDGGYVTGEEPIPTDTSSSIKWESIAEEDISNSVELQSEFENSESIEEMRDEEAKRFGSAVDVLNHKRSSPWVCAERRDRQFCNFNARRGMVSTDILRSVAKARDIFRKRGMKMECHIMGVIGELGEELIGRIRREGRESGISKTLKNHEEEQPVRLLLNSFMCDEVASAYVSELIRMLETFTATERTFARLVAGARSLRDDEEREKMVYMVRTAEREVNQQTLNISIDAMFDRLNSMKRILQTRKVIQAMLGSTETVSSVEISDEYSCILGAFEDYEDWASRVSKKYKVDVRLAVNEAILMMVRKVSCPKSFAGLMKSIGSVIEGVCRDLAIKESHTWRQRPGIRDLAFDCSAGSVTVGGYALNLPRSELNWYMENCNQSRVAEAAVRMVVSGIFRTIVNMGCVKVDGFQWVDVPILFMPHSAMGYSEPFFEEDFTLMPGSLRCAPNERMGKIGGRKIATESKHDVWFTTKTTKVRADEDCARREFGLRVRNGRLIEDESVEILAQSAQLIERIGLALKELPAPDNVVVGQVNYKEVVTKRIGCKGHFSTSVVCDKDLSEALHTLLHWKLRADQLIVLQLGPQSKYLNYSSRVGIVVEGDFVPLKVRKVISGCVVFSTSRTVEIGFGRIDVIDVHGGINTMVGYRAKLSVTKGEVGDLSIEIKGNTDISLTLSELRNRCSVVSGSITVATGCIKLNVTGVARIGLVPSCGANCCGR